MNAEKGILVFKKILGSLAPFETSFILQLPSSPYWGSMLLLLCSSRFAGKSTAFLISLAVDSPSGFSASSCRCRSLN